MSERDMIELQDQGVIDATIFITKLKAELAEAKSRLAALTTWTRAAPTVPGWYWARHPYIQGLVMVPVNQADIDLATYKDGAQWAGPIPEPSEPREEGGQVA